MARTSSIGRRLSALKQQVFHLPLRRRRVLLFGLAAFVAVAAIGALQLALAAPPTDADGRWRNGGVQDREDIAPELAAAHPAEASDDHGGRLRPRGGGGAAQLMGIAALTWKSGVVAQAGNAGNAFQDAPQMEVIANLIAAKHRLRSGATFRSVAIKPPWAYVLDRDGSLFVFPIPGKAQSVEQSPTTIVKNAGDGNDLKVVGQVLLCTRDGAIEAYSLKIPGKPARLGLFGPDGKHAYRSQSLAIEGKRAFLLGRDAILAYDLSDPKRPKYVSVLRTGRFGWTGCVSGRYLYVGEIHVERGDRQGIAVYDVADLRNVRPAGFTPTRIAPYHLFALPGNCLLASQDDDSRFRISLGTTVDGNAALFSLSKPAQPVLLKEFAKCGGRTAALLQSEGGPFLICNGGVFAVARGMKQCSSIDLDGSTLDGLPYHGDDSGPFAALAMDRNVVVVRMMDASISACGKKSRTESDADKIQGAWTPIAEEEHGKVPSKSEAATISDGGIALAFRWNRVRISCPLGDLPFSFTLDATKSPKELDIREGPEGGSQMFAKCIYRIEDDTLKICWGSENARPKEFKTTEGQELSVLKRVKPREKQAPPAKRVASTLEGDWLRISAVDDNGKLRQGASVKLETPSGIIITKSITLKSGGDFQATGATSLDDAGNGPAGHKVDSPRDARPR